MAGTHTIIEMLSYRLLERWVPKWYEAFSDLERGGFYERLGHSFRPIKTGQRRLLTQCRQLALYSHARVQGIGRALPDLEARFAFLVDHYYIEKTGGWRFSIDDENRPLDDTQDLYALGFVIFALAHYYRASGDVQVMELGRNTLAFIDRHFRVAGLSGFTEALDEKLQPVARVRRHESHMHLLEACLFAGRIFGDPAYNRMADELVDMFLTYFYEPEKNRLSEYFTDDLRACGADGRRVRPAIIVEPGHYCEWIWLLKKYAKGRGTPEHYDALCKPMLEWASTKGWDHEFGGIYDELNAVGEIVRDTKRIWPLTEALKANALMLDSEGIDKVAVKGRIRRMAKVLRDHYMDERGFWTEWLRRDLDPETDYMPGTTPYHVYFGIMETRDVIRGRGPTRSLMGGTQVALYSWRRKASNVVREIRLGLKGVAA